MPEQTCWTLGAFAVMAALAAVLSKDTTVVIVCGALAVFLYWGGARYGRQG